MLNRVWRTFRAGAAAPTDDFWYEPLTRTNAAGARVSAETAMRVSIVFACVKVLAETLASVPLILYRRLPKGGKERADDHPLSAVLRRRPNRWQTSFEFREMMQGHLALRGNAYARIVPGPQGFADQLVPLHPDRVRPRRLPNQRILYEFSPAPPDSGLVRLTQDEVLHIRGMSADGMVGINPIDQAAEVLGITIAADKYAARFYRNNARPMGILKHPGRFKTDEDREDFRRRWREAHAGEMQHNVAVLESGMEWQDIGVTARNAQFLDMRKFQATEVARIYRMPPHKVGILDKATFSNIEQQAIEFVQDTMLPWFVRWEQALTRDLILDPDQFFIEFLIDGLLRGDLKTRFEAYVLAVTNGIMTRNEVRIRENMNPLPGLDAPLRPLNMAEEGVPANGAGGSATLRALVSDAAGRVVRAETRELIKLIRASSGGENYEGRTAAFYARHAEFMRRTFAPLCQARLDETGVAIDATDLARQYSDYARRLAVDLATLHEHRLEPLEQAMQQSEAGRIELITVMVMEPNHADAEA